MPYDTILIGTDGSGTATVAEGVALALAKATGGRVLVVSAFEGKKAEKASRAALEAARERAASEGVEAEAEIMGAEPAEAIVELADRRDAGLIVLGDVGMGPARRFKLGGVPDRVSHEMPCDLLIVRTAKGERAAPPGEYRNVLIATDGSPTADRAARVGADFAKGVGASITLVHVGEEAIGGIVLRDTAERLGQPAEARAIGGEPGPAIVELATEEGHDLVVVGNKGMHGRMRFLLGVVPDRVTHDAPCDVLIVNTADRKIEDLEPGEGAVVEVDGTKVAAFRRDDGGLITLSPKCKHMGCTVGWNHRAKTWDCPCHGSRYETDGTVKNGPTRHPLDPIEVS